MFDEYRMEDLVIQGIYIFRDTKRKRATKKDIYIYVQEFFDETIIDFDEFLSTIASMEERRLIIKVNATKNRIIFQKSLKTLFSQITLLL